MAKLTYRQRDVLRLLAGGEWRRFGGSHPATTARLLVLGLVEHGVDPACGLKSYRITPAGRRALLEEEGK